MSNTGVYKKRLIFQTGFFALCCFLLLGLNASYAAESPKILTPVQMMESLEFVENTVRSAHVGSANGLSTHAEAALQRSRREITSSKSVESFYFVLNRFLKILDDAHTVVRLKEETAEEYEYIDLPMYWNDNGIFVTRDTSVLARGESILHIGNLDASALLEKLSKVIPAENEAFIKGQASTLLQRADYLRMLQVLGQEECVDIEVLSTNGITRSVDLCLTPGRPDYSLRNWVGYRTWPKESLGLFWFDKFEYNEELAQTMERFFRQVESENTKKIVVDLRGNPGGNSAVAFAFLEHFSDITYQAFSVKVHLSKELESLQPKFSRESINQLFQQFGLATIPSSSKQYVLNADLIKPLVISRLNIIPPEDMTKISDRDIYLLTDSRTFSSGNLFAILIKDNAIGTIIGEPTGNKINFNGSELRFDVPYTNLYLNLSTAQMIRPKSELGNENAIMPDVLIPTTPHALSEGVDLQLRYLLNTR